jgi:hypothetical protein
VMALLARGELSIDINRVPLARVSEVWNQDQMGSRTILIPQ